MGTKTAESKEPMTVVKKRVVSGIVTRIDLLEYISNIEEEEEEWKGEKKVSVEDEYI